MSSRPWQALSTSAHVHGARGPLQVVRGAEERLEQARRIALAALEREEIAVEAADVLRHLLDEGGHQALDERGLVHAVHRIISVRRRPASLRAWAVRSACWVAARCWLDAWLMLLMA